MTLSAPIYELKRQAKTLKREKSMPLNKALDMIARREGIESWSLLISKYNEKRKPPARQPSSPDVELTELPLSPEDRLEFIELAKSTFEMAMRRIEPDNPELTRQLWDVEKYVDNHLHQSMLPISKDYALSLIEATLWHSVVSAAVKADEIRLKHNGSTTDKSGSRPLLLCRAID